MHEIHNRKHRFVLQEKQNVRQRNEFYTSQIGTYRFGLKMSQNGRQRFGFQERKTVDICLV